MTHSDPDGPDSPRPHRDRPVLSAGLRSELEGRLLDERERSRHGLDLVPEGAIDEALVRLRKHPDRYGACETCGASIDLERLEVIPWARHCGEHVDPEAPRPPGRGG